ncbi:MAG: hypothetical protein QOK03_721 [Candidatus Binataceae bacterium]|nr:hypothetical protein [Candidatus Binataceae bacterium]
MCAEWREDFFVGARGGEVQAIEDSFLADAQAAVGHFGNNISEFAVVLIVGEEEVEARVAGLGAGIKVNERFNEVASQGLAEAAGVGGEDVATDGVMYLCGGARAGIARNLSSEGLAQDGFTHLAVQLFAKAFV